MKQYRLYILDLDGTVYRGSEVLPHAAETISQLRARGAAIRFLTNNSGHTQQYIADKLTNMGIQCLPLEVISSATGAAAWCCSERIKSAFVVGEPGLAKTLYAVGIRVTNWDGDAFVHPDAAPQAEAVVAGICRSFTYTWMKAAMQQILAGARFVATNPDPTYPLEEGRLEPGAGSIVAGIRTCSGVEPHLIGKPKPYLINLILEELRLDPKEALVVGDRPDTDLEAGRAAGCDTFLVLTGVTRLSIPGQPGSADLRGLLAQ